MHPFQHHRAVFSHLGEMSISAFVTSSDWKSGVHSEGEKLRRKAFKNFGTNCSVN